MDAGVLTSLRAAAAVSRTMRIAAANGAVDELAADMARQDGLLRQASDGLSAMEEAGGALSADDREVLGGMLAEFAAENGLLIQTLREQQQHIVRCIAEAEGYRRLSAYAR